MRVRSQRSRCAVDLPQPEDGQPAARGLVRVRVRARFRVRVRVISPSPSPNPVNP